MPYAVLFVLLMNSSASGGVALHTQVFSSMQACAAAKQELQAVLPVGGPARVGVFCFEGAVK